MNYLNRLVSLEIFLVIDVRVFNSSKYIQILMLLHDPSTLKQKQVHHRLPIAYILGQLKVKLVISCHFVICQEHVDIDLNPRPGMFQIMQLESIISLFELQFFICNNNNSHCYQFVVSVKRNREFMQHKLEAVKLTFVGSSNSRTGSSSITSIIFMLH